MWTRKGVRALMARTKTLDLNRQSTNPVLGHPPIRSCTFEELPKWPKDDAPLHEQFTKGVKILRQECRMFVEEKKEALKLDMPKFYPGDIHPEYRFNKEETFEKFMTVTDSDHQQGFSTATLTPTRNGTALFKGILDTRVPKDGEHHKAGIAALMSLPRLRSFQRTLYYEWGQWTHMVVRCRGDGRSYMMNVGVLGQYDIHRYMVYQYPLYTRGGPYWQLTYIPFSKFFLSSKGRIQDKQDPLPRDHVRRFGIALGDKKPGPFELEIDFIGFMCRDLNPERSAYEMYETPDAYGHGY